MRFREGFLSLSDQQEKVSEWVQPERSKDDRSQFVRYARVAMEIEALRREGDLESCSPTIFRQESNEIGLVELKRLEQSGYACSKRKNAEIEHAQRILEATRCHLDFPVFSGVKTESGSWKDLVCHSGSATVLAAFETQRELVRNTEVMPEDFLPLKIFDRSHPEISVYSNKVEIKSKVLSSARLLANLSEQFPTSAIQKQTTMHENPKEVPLGNFDFCLKNQETDITVELESCEELARHLSQGTKHSTNDFLGFVLSRLTGHSPDDVFTHLSFLSLNAEADAESTIIEFSEPTEEELALMASESFVLPGEMFGIQDDVSQGALMWSLKDFSS